MNFGVFVFTLLTFSKETHFSSVENTRASNEYVLDNKYFQMNSDATYAEEMAVAYAKLKNTKHNIILSIMSRIKWTTNICHQSSEVKYEFCAELQQIKYYGLQFDSDEHKNSKCIPRKFSVKHISQIESNDFKLSMFTCPRLFYIDLETNKKATWIYQYYISRSEEQNSALVFIQRGSEQPIYSRKYASQINFRKLESSFRERVTYLESSVENKFSISNRKQLDIEIYNYINAKHMTAPYQKFVQLFSSTNVCGLRRTHKIYMCRRAFDLFTSNAELNFADFDEEKCRNHGVYFRSKIEFNLQPKNRLFVLHCSALLSTQILGEKKFNHHYISSNINSEGFIMFTRINKKGEKLIPKFYRNSLKMSLMIEDVRRKKILPWSSQRQQTRRPYRRSGRDLVEELDKIEAGVNMPPIIMRTRYLTLSAQSAQIKTQRLLVDDLTIAFSKIKNIKLPYHKFRTTYGSLDICKLTWRQFTNLCNDILEAPRYHLTRMDYHTTRFKYSCARRKILLNFRETENLVKNNFTMWLCPHFVDDSIKHYYVSKTYLKNAVMVFTSQETEYKEWKRKKALPTDYFYPEAVVVNIKTLVTN